MLEKTNIFPPCINQLEFETARLLLVINVNAELLPYFKLSSIFANMKIMISILKNNQKSRFNFHSYLQHRSASINTFIHQRSTGNSFKKYPKPVYSGQYKDGRMKLSKLLKLCFWNKPVNTELTEKSNEKLKIRNLEWHIFKQSPPIMTYINNIISLTYIELKYLMGWLPCLFRFLSNNIGLNKVKFVLCILHVSWLIWVYYMF